MTASETPSPAGASKGGIGLWVKQYVLLGWLANAGFAIPFAFAFKKALPGVFGKMAKHYENKYIAQQEKKLLSNLEDKLPEASTAVIREEIQEKAQEYGIKTAESRLLLSGGFVVAPLQSGLEVLSKNQKRHESARARGVPVSVLGPAPRYQPYGAEASRNLPKWMAGRSAAIGAAFFAQSIVDDRFSEKKESIDRAIAKTVCRAMGKGSDHTYTDEQGKETDIDPKVFKTVQMFTTDAYMTVVAVVTQNLAQRGWENTAPYARKGMAAVSNLLSGASKSI